MGAGMAGSSENVVQDGMDVGLGEELLVRSDVGSDFLRPRQGSSYL